MVILPGTEVFTEAEVGNLDVTGGVEQEILQLEVAVDEVVGMKKPDCQNDLSHVEASLLFGKTTLLEQLVVQLPADSIFQDQAQSVRKQRSLFSINSCT